MRLMGLVWTDAPRARVNAAIKDIRDAQEASGGWSQFGRTTPDAYATLDATRASFLERKRDERRNIAVIALAIWALVGGGIAYGWFRRVPWDDLA